MKPKKKALQRNIFLHFTGYFFVFLWYIRHALIAILAFIILCALLIYLVESMSFGEALYFTFVTAFTIGFGDITPDSSIGKLLSIIVGLIGIVFTGIIVAVSVRALTHAIEDEREE